MGIYIPGVEMPRSCFYCPFQHKTTTECLITHKYYNWGLTTPPSDCPIISVPPHGRLIDADALKMSDRMVGKLMMYGGEYVYTQSEIDRAPAIIPAEEGET